MLPFSQWISFLREDAQTSDRMDFFHSLSEYELRAAFEAEIEPQVIDILFFLENYLATA